MLQRLLLKTEPREKPQLQNKNELKCIRLNFRWMCFFIRLIKRWEVAARLNEVQPAAPLQGCREKRQGVFAQPPDCRSAEIFKKHYDTADISPKFHIYII